MKAKIIPGCIEKSTATSRKMTILLYSSFVSVHLEYHVHFQASQHKKDVDKLEPVENEDVQGPEQTSSARTSSGKLGLSSVESRTGRKDSIIAFQYLQG